MENEERGRPLRPAWVMPTVIVSAWVLFALFTTAQEFVGSIFTGRPFLWFENLAYPVAQSLTWALLTPFLLMVASRVQFRRGRVGISLVTLLGATVAVAAAKITLDFLLFPLFTTITVPESGLALFRRLFAVRIYLSFVTAAVITGLSLAVVNYDLYRDRELRARELSERLAQAQLQVLEMQLNPHFLFNCLQSIAELMHADVDAADRMIGRLSDLLRLSLSRLGVHELSLREELDFLHQYLAIEEIRFSDRLSVEFDVDPAVLDAAVPSLVLQPLVENAVKHGIARRVEPGRVRIAAHRENSHLLLEVADNGPGLGVPRPERIGLANTRARLQQLFDRDQQFTLHDDQAGGLRVELSIPFRLMRNEA